MGMANKIMRGSTEAENPLHYLPARGIDIVLFKDGDASLDNLVFNVKTYVDNQSLFKRVILSPVSHPDPKAFEFRYDSSNDKTGRILDPHPAGRIQFVGRGDDGYPTAEINPPDCATIRYQILDIDHEDPKGFWMFHPASDTAFSYNPKKRLFTPLSYDSEFPSDLSPREIHIP